jgi:hypothetical protein
MQAPDPVAALPAYPEAEEWARKQLREAGRRVAASMRSGDA